MCKDLIFMCIRQTSKPETHSSEALGLSRLVYIANFEPRRVRVQAAKNEQVAVILRAASLLRLYVFG